MSKCLAPLLLVASTVAPHAQDCPTFSNHENYICETQDKNENPTDQKKFGLVLRQDVNGGVRSYKVTTYRKPEQEIIRRDAELTVGSPGDQRFSGQGMAVPATCGVFVGQKNKQPANALVTLTLQADGRTARTFFFPQGGAIVRLMIDADNRLSEKHVCRPHFEKKLPPAKTP